MTTYRSSEAREDYAPPMAGNGEIALFIDGEGNTRPDIGIRWAGRRKANSHTAPLSPFGFFRFSLGCGCECGEWSETLDPLKGTITCETVYPVDGGKVEVKTVAFVHADRNIIVIRKELCGLPAEGLPFAFVYELDTERLSSTPTIADRKIALSYTHDGRWFSRGRITLSADFDVDCDIDWAKHILSGRLTDGEYTFFITLTDDRYGTDPEADSAVLNGMVAEGYTALLESHKAAWSAYHAEGSVILPDEKLQEIYNTAAYHLRITTTRWSIPVNLCDTHWHGRYFAFDEYYSLRGLLTSGHMQLAIRVPEFRFKGLEHAITRQSSKNVREAYYPWETLEDGTEGAPYGYWMQHIFHMAHAARGAWEYYHYTGDPEFLREKAYPIITACAEFFRRHMVYRDNSGVTGGRTIIGSCTDLERLGSSIKNPFMTTCSVITTFNALTEAAAILGEENEMTAECAELAFELKRDLPHDGEKYVPYPGCDQRSIGVFCGTFPYYVLDPSDEKQRRAAEDYCAHEHVYGNMYAMGSGVSSWYALWKSLSYSRWQEPELAAAALGQAAATAGCFSEMYEINEPGHRIRPWFSTSSGIMLNCINELLVQSEHGRLLIAPGVPESWRSFEFTLPVIGGSKLHCKVSDGRLKAFEFIGADPELEIVFPEWIKR